MACLSASFGMATTKNIGRRKEGFLPWKKKRQVLGITDKYLAEELITYKAGGATEVTLTREEAIGVYIYNRNRMAREKLVSHGGNGMSLFDVIDIISKLDKKDLAFGDYLIDSIGGDEEYNRLKECDLQDI